MERSGAFDYILLETTGLADPGNIAPLFWVDEGLGSTIYLDGIVTLVDAKNVMRSLDAPVEDEVPNNVDHEHHGGQVLSIAHLQISHADVIVLNKADLVSQAELEMVKARIQSINALAKIQITDHSQVPQLEGLVLDLHAYDNVTSENLEFAAKGHSHLDPSIGTMTLDVTILDPEHGLDKLDEWLRTILWEHSVPGAPAANTTWEIHRVKGRIMMRDGRLKILQGVREIFELIDGKTNEDATEADTAGRIVFIGRNIGDEKNQKLFQRSLDSTLTLPTE